MSYKEPWNRIKPPEYHAASEFERMQWACGIPQRFWNTKLSSIHPVTAKYDFKDEVQQVKVSDQLEYLTERERNPELLDCNRFACFTSIPTDEHALAAACLLATAYISQEWKAHRAIRVRVDDIQDYEKCLSVGKDFYSTDPDVVILYNFNDNSSRERLTLASDLLKNKFEGVYRAVVAASDSPLKFAKEKLFLEPQEVYHFEGKPRKVSSR
jgi:hypothetical protein